MKCRKNVSYSYQIRIFNVSSGDTKKILLHYFLAIIQCFFFYTHEWIQDILLTTKPQKMRKKYKSKEQNVNSGFGYSVAVCCTICFV